MGNTVATHYAQRVQDGQLERDAAQEAIVLHFDALVDQLRGYDLARKSSALGWLFGKKRTPEAPKGLYIWGKVGRGKTMLMDLFFESVDVHRKRRAHFHGFMADVHVRIHDWRQKKRQGLVKGEDPIAPVAADLAENACLLCFDEFSVTDIADAMILGRLFTALFAAGVVVVATSNVEPSRLYEGGLNRALFLPFIGKLQERLNIVELDSRTDFRLEKLAGAPVYYVPADAAAEAALSRSFQSLTGRQTGDRATLDVLGRTLVVPRTAAHVARFSFAELCEAPLGSPDYLAIAENYHTVIIDGIPQMRDENRNEAKRFINLIDTLYDQCVKVLASAAAPPAELYLGTYGREAFEFERTASRLIEMQSTAYLSLPHGRASSAASGDSTGLVET